MPGPSRQKIELIGGASGHKKSYPLSSWAKEGQSLMEFFMENSHPIASSCQGEGVCHKCVVKIQGDLHLSCQIDRPGLLSKLGDDIICEVKIDYL